MSISEHDLTDLANMLRSDFSKELEDLRLTMSRGPKVQLIRSTDRAEIDQIERRLDTLERAIERLMGIVEDIALEVTAN